MLQRRQFLALCGGSLVVLGCQQAQEATDQGEADPTAGRLRWGVSDRLRTLDPGDAYEPLGLNILLNVGETLYTYGDAGLEPLLATALPEVSDDGLTYRISLREDVVFHDGTAFDAEAMAFSLQRARDRGGKPAFLLLDLVETIAASDTYELTLTLKYPFSGTTALLTFPGFCAVSPSVYDLDTWLPDQVVATGPYQLTRYQDNSVLSLSRFDDYWGEPAANTGIDVQFFANSSSMVNALRTGAIDFAFQTLEPSQIESLTDDWQVVGQRSALIRYLVLNTQLEPLNNLSVRQAIAAAIDRSLLQERVFLGQAEPLYSLVPPNLPGAVEVFPRTDVDQARQFLREAGFSEANPAQTSLWYAAENTRAELIARTLQANLQTSLEGLLNLDLQAVEAATLFSNLNKGTYPLVLLGWGPDFLDADNYLQPFVGCDRIEANACLEGAAFEHGTFWGDSELQTLVQAQREAPASERDAILERLQTRIAETIPFIPLIQGQDVAVARPDLSGISLTPQQGLRLWHLQA